jgi:hypothetical protein
MQPQDLTRPGATGRPKQTGGHSNAWTVSSATGRSSTAWLTGKVAIQAESKRCSPTAGPGDPSVPEGMAALRQRIESSPSTTRNRLLWAWYSTPHGNPVRAFRCDALYTASHRTGKCRMPSHGSSGPCATVKRRPAASPHKSAGPSSWDGDGHLASEEIVMTTTLCVAAAMSPPPQVPIRSPSGPSSRPITCLAARLASADRKLPGPSGDTASAARMAAVNTTGLSEPESTVS